MYDFRQSRPRPRRPFRRHRPALFAGRGGRGCAARSRSSTASPAAAPTGCGSFSHTEDYVNALGAVTGNQAMQMVRAGLKAIYLSGWQVAADANTAGAMYPDQSLYPANAGPELCRRINRTLQRADQIEHAEGGAHARLVRADRRRRRGRLRRPAQLLRDHEGLYRGRRRGGPFRGPARLREEVRPSRRQGADPDPGAYPQPRLRPPRRRRLRRPDPGRRPDRRRERPADHLRRRRARPRMADRRAHSGGLLPTPRRNRSRSLHQARPRLRALCRSAVVGDQQSQSRRRPALRRSDPERISGQDDGL